MSNAGKKMVNWKRDHAVLRVALGLLRRDGFTSLHAARFLMSHEATAAVREDCLRLGRELTDEALASRMKRIEELDWLETNRPAMFKAGKALSRVLKRDLRAAHIESFSALG
jgi:hypothetical protein